jgi:flagellin-like protein
MSKLMNKLCMKGLQAQKKLQKLWSDERGETNIIAIILILAIVIALAIIFRTQLTALFNKIWSSLFSNVDNVIS